MPKAEQAGWGGELPQYSLSQVTAHAHHCGKAGSASRNPGSLQVLTALEQMAWVLLPTPRLLVAWVTSSDLRILRSSLGMWKE